MMMMLIVLACCCFVLHWCDLRLVSVSAWTTIVRRLSFHSVSPPGLIGFHVPNYYTLLKLPQKNPCFPEVDPLASNLKILKVF
jgi:hypothetical protein